MTPTAPYSSLKLLKCYPLVSSFILMDMIKFCLTLELKILGAEAVGPWSCLTQDRWVQELPTQETGAWPCFEQTLVS